MDWMRIIIMFIVWCVSFVSFGQSKPKRDTSKDRVETPKTPHEKIGVDGNNLTKTTTTGGYHPPKKIECTIYCKTNVPDIHIYVDGNSLPYSTSTYKSIFLKQGDHKLTASASGYKPYSSTIYVSKNNTRFDIELQSETENVSQTYNNGDKYVGYVTNGVRNGYGTYYWKSGDKYYGQWVNGVRSGSGIFTWANGDTYVGECRNGKFYGSGVFHYNNSLCVSGVFDSEGYWKESQRWYEEIKYTNGGKYIGSSFNKQQPNGQGTYYFPNGDRFVGIWKSVYGGGFVGYGTYYSTNYGTSKLNRKRGYVNSSFYFYKKNKILKRQWKIGSINNATHYNPQQRHTSGSFMNAINY